MPRVWSESADVKADHVGAAEEIVELHILDAELAASFGRWPEGPGEHVHPERTAEGRCPRAVVSGPHDARRLSAEEDRVLL